MKALAAMVALALAAAGAAAPDALEPTRVAAASGDAEAQFALGEALRTGRGAPADHEAAIMWYKRAAAQGHAEASDIVGFMLFAADRRSEAMPYIEKAAARGDPRAFYLLGTAHFNGDYAARDWPLAYAQMSRAAEAGVMAAKKSLIVMNKYLLPADRAKAEAILTTLPPNRKLGAPTPHMPAPPSAPAAAGSTTTAPPAGHDPAPSGAIDSAKAAISTRPTPPPSTSPSPAPVRTAGGAWRVQLGAYASADRARTDWERLARRVPALRQYEPRVVQAAPGVQRLQAANIADRRAADALCRQVHATGGACFALAP